MKTPQRSKKKKKMKQPNMLVIAALALFFLFLFYNIGKNQYDLIRLKQKKQQLTEDLQNESQRQDELNEQIEKSTNLEYIEYLAKKYLNMIFPNETKVMLTNEEKE